MVEVYEGLMVGLVYVGLIDGRAVEYMVGLRVVVGSEVSERDGSHDGMRVGSFVGMEVVSTEGLIVDSDEGRNALMRLDTSVCWIDFVRVVEIPLIVLSIVVNSIFSSEGVLRI